MPTAAVVKDGKLGGDVPRPPGDKPAYKRRMRNFLLDKKLQLRYVILVTSLSAVITAALGGMMYRQEHHVTEALTADVVAQTGDQELADQAESDMEAEDLNLIFTMIGVGTGLVLILSLYLVVMTHKVAGPLYKVSLYFDKMAVGRLGQVTALRKGDMLVDFYSNFREMHDAVRARMQGDLDVMQRFLESATTAAKTPGVAGELDQLAKHVAARKDALS